MTLQDVMELAKQLSPMDKKCLVEQLSSEVKPEEVKPKTLEEIKAILILYKPFLIERFKILELGLFGSYVRGEQTKDSDVDILVEFDRPVTFDLYMDVKFYLEDNLGTRVDLVSNLMLKPLIRSTVEQEAIYVA